MTGSLLFIPPQPVRVEPGQVWRPVRRRVFPVAITAVTGALVDTARGRTTVFRLYRDYRLTADPRSARASSVDPVAEGDMNTVRRLLASVARHRPAHGTHMLSLWQGADA